MPHRVSMYTDVYFTRLTSTEVSLLDHTLCFTGETPTLFTLGLQKPSHILTIKDENIRLSTEYCIALIYIFLVTFIIVYYF